MNEITILAFAGFREKFGEKNTVTAPKGATVLSVLRTFTETIPAARNELFDGGNLRGHVILMYNRERIDADDAEEIAVSDGDEIVLYPPVSGG
ncbi:MAG: MoaD/ThiS family protein [Methanocorpusculum sp.]|nr:MoaD/ThiS family protein [Methanocorpusculum sp.]MDE2523254.1 MoaD/ThiS family protein [Methanocorpusculum sp.]MDE2525231.1 MoaD/ThiS family protein [Methanocorpusculum sp.]